ncbi:colicin immunity protein [Citrobacter portucalensis]|nr:colicin immunity protein [Citrobacter freundii]QCD03557.1 colicin immunity protein [Citrobacter portucalensis]RHH45546.1 colicin immunity protein [Citrobacter portucalensis]RWT91887.1 colicin immunity protein [Citrobacter freundii]
MINVVLMIILNHGFITPDKLLSIFIIGNLSREIPTK